MENSNNKRILKNTLFLYIRMFLALAVALYTSRVVLNTLGVVDYGIYNVVGGIVTMFTIITATMAGSTQRFLSLELGKVENGRVGETFNMFLTLHLILAVIVLLLGESVGFIFLFKNLVIPQERFWAASVVYHFSVFAFMVSIIKAPYDACLVAKENMKIYAYLGILDVVTKLIIVYILNVVIYDHLIMYAFMLFVVSSIITVISMIYVYKKYSEFRFMLFWDKHLFKSVSKYIGWNYLTAIGDVARFQGVNVILNIFFGPTVNAARGIAFQVQANVMNFVRNFQASVNPQLVKYHAKDDDEQMIFLMAKSCKISFGVLLLLAAPIIANCEYILTIWLGEIPKYSVLFCQLVLIQSLLECIAYPLWTVVGAIGKLRFSHLLGSFLYLIIPIFSYVILKSGAEPPIVFYISIFVMGLVLMMLIFRVNMLVPGYLRLLISDILVIPFLLVLIMSIVIIVCSNFLKPMLFYSFLQSSILIVFVHLVAFYLLGLNSNERTQIIGYIKNKFL